MNKELQDANEELQAANEELMLTQEELQATNEEFEATNEELQATNEELETNNEELQATNEELQTTNDELTARDASSEITVGVWRKWRLELLRLGTRETTAVLYLDEEGRMQEQIRLDWDSTTHEPSKLRAGIGFSSRGAAATVWSDELRLTECELSL